MAQETIYDLDDAAEPAEQVSATNEVDDDPYAGKREVLEDGSVRLELLYPQTVRFRDAMKQEREETIFELRIKRTNGALLRQLMRNHKDEEKCIIILWKHLTGHLETVFDQLDGEDIMRFTAEIEHFLPSRQGVGKKS